MFPLFYAEFYEILSSLHVMMNDVLEKYLSRESTLGTMWWSHHRARRQWIGVCGQGMVDLQDQHWAHTYGMIVHFSCQVKNRNAVSAVIQLTKITVNCLSEGQIKNQKRRISTQQQTIIWVYSMANPCDWRFLSNSLCPRIIFWFHPSPVIISCSVESSSPSMMVKKLSWSSNKIWKPIKMGQSMCAWIQSDNVWSKSCSGGNHNIEFCWF